MSTNSSLDRESFQQLLAAAFAVQESRMDTQSLSAIIEIQRLIAAGDLDVDNAVYLIANHARNVANAAGVAIGVIQGHQLVYRAGIGSAAPYAGRHITATLSVSADNTKMGREILRVENAQTDPRIEAAICRQFGAESLLIMPIYQGQTVTGVLEVLFSEAHAFEDRELRAYRLMAGLVGEAMSRAARHEKEGCSAEVLPPPTEQATAQIQEFTAGDKADDYVAGPANENAPYQVYEAASALAGRLPAFWRLPGAARMIRQRVQRLPLHTPQWSAAIAAAVAITIVGWTAYGNRRPVSPGTPVLRTSNAADQHGDATSTNPVPVSAISQSQSASGVANPTKPSRSAFKRIRVGENEIDYIADDVTVRHFIPDPSQRRLHAGYNQVEFGKDVTVRYFASNGAAVSSTSAAGVVQPVNRTLREPDKSVTRKLAR